MSTLYTPEIASLYGALDSNAFSDGMPVSSHVLRTQVMSTNRLAAKAQHLVCTPYGNSYDLAEFTVNGVYLPVPLEWTQILAPIPLFKMPGSTRAQVRVRANVSNDGGAQTVLMQIATLAAPFDPNASVDAPNVLTIAGSGAVASYGSAIDSPGIPIVKGDFDIATVWVKGNITAEASALTPNDSTDAFAVGVVSKDSITVSDATWDQDVLPSGVYIEFYDTNGQTIARRNISNVYPPGAAGTTLEWTTDLTPSELSLIRQARTDDPTGLWWATYIAPRMGLVCFSMASIARTT